MAIDLCEESGNHADAGYTYMFLEKCHLLKGDLARVLAEKEDFVRNMRGRLSSRTDVWTLTATSQILSFLGSWEEAIEEGKKAMDIAQECSDSSLVSWAASNISVAYAYKGNMERAIEYAKIGVHEAPTPGDEYLARGFLGWAWCKAGEPKKGIDDLVRFVEIAQATRFVSGEIFGGTMLGEGYLLAGEFQKAKETLARVLDLAEHCEAKRFRGQAHHLLGEIALKSNLDEAAPNSEQAISIFQEIKAENFLALA